MKKIFKCALTGLGLLTVGVGSANAAAALQNPLVKIDAVIQEYTGPMPECPSKFGGTITASGTSDLLGRVVLIATDCITPIGPLFNFSNGKLIVMTTDGSQIFANYSGQFIPTGNGANYVFSGATFQVTGGNGAYSKATGGGFFTGGEDLQTGAGTLKMTGAIFYRGKDNR